MSKSKIYWPGIWQTDSLINRSQKFICVFHCTKYHVTCILVLFRRFQVLQNRFFDQVLDSKTVFPIGIDFKTASRFKSGLYV